MSRKASITPATITTAKQTIEEKIALTVKTGDATTEELVPLFAALSELSSVDVGEATEPAPKTRAVRASRKRGLPSEPAPDTIS